MNYNIRGENIEVIVVLKDYVEKKIGKLECYFDYSVNVDVNVNLKFYNDKEFKVEVMILMIDLVFWFEVYNEDMYNVIDFVINKLEC